jgi:hypothetical protein
MNKLLLVCALLSPAAFAASPHQCTIAEQPIVLENGWENYGGPFGPATVSKDCTGLIRLSGSIRNPGLQTGGEQHSTAFTLPLTFCPKYYEIFPTFFGGEGGEILFIPPYGHSYRCSVIVVFGSRAITPLTPISYR